MTEEKLKETEIEIHLVAFLDILGFENHVLKFFNPQKETDKDILKNMKESYEKALKSPYLDFFNTISEFESVDLPKIQYKQFSDCTCMSILDLNENSELGALNVCSFIHLLSDFYYNMILEHLYLIRGGIAIGFHYEDDNMIFSEGLIKSYKLEKKSVYPRIILDDELIQRIQNLWTEQKEMMVLLGVNKLLLRDWDGTIFINPFIPSQTMEKMMSEKKMKLLPFIDEKRDLIEQLTAKDNELHRYFLSQLNDKIEELKKDDEDKYVIRKYIWLKELVTWNLDPNSSKIQFEYVLKGH